MAPLSPRGVVDLAEASHLAVTGQGRSLRQRSRLSQRALAGAIGIHPSTLNRWEGGTRVPSGMAAIRWVRLLRTLDAAEQARVAP